MKIEITCDCGAKVTVDEDDVFYRDTTPCSCGQCYGESYNIQFGECPNCRETFVIQH